MLGPVLGLEPTVLATRSVLKLELMVTAIQLVLMAWSQERTRFQRQPKGWSLEHPGYQVFCFAPSYHAELEGLYPSFGLSTIWHSGKVLHRPSKNWAHTLSNL